LSHIVQIQTQVRDGFAVAAACRRLGLPEPVQNTVEIFSSTETGLCVQLPGWNFPVVCDLSTGSLKFDNYGGQWGEQKHLDQFLQAYAIEKTKLEARKQGHNVLEQSLQDGSIKLTVQVGGVA